MSTVQMEKPPTFSKGGRLTMAQSVLNSLPLYYSLLKTPEEIIEVMEKCVRDFFWDGDFFLPYLVKWEWASLPLSNNETMDSC